MQRESNVVKTITLEDDEFALVAKKGGILFLSGSELTTDTTYYQSSMLLLAIADKLGNDPAFKQSLLDHSLTEGHMRPKKLNS